MIGVNAWNPDPEKLKKVMLKEKLNWRSFADGGVIGRQWNLPGTPAYYAIDHKGMIRRKWIGSPGNETIDAVLETLIHEAEHKTAVE